MNGDSFWKSIERFKLVIELTTSLFVAVPIIYAFAQGLSAPIPAWAVLLISIVAIGLGYLLGRNSNNKIMLTTKSGDISNRELLQLVDFNYQDSPAKHKWVISTPDEAQPVITHIPDGFWGNAIKIESSVMYAIDLPVEPIALIGKWIEIVAKVEKGYGLYSLGNYTSADGSTRKNIWFNYKIGNGEPSVFNADKSEWLVYIEPEILKGDWQKFNINLQDVISKSVAKDGWRLNELTRFRLRGNVQIARIRVLR